VDVSAAIEFHLSHGRLATMTSTYPPGRFGAIETQDNQVTNFIEKPGGENGLINAGYFVLNKKVLKYILDGSTMWEQEPLRKLAADGELMTYKHGGFWQPMDTLRDKTYLNDLWTQSKAPWKLW